MDLRFAASRDDLYNVQMEVKQLQITQHSHAERLMRVEKRLSEDAAVKSVWATPQFPSALSGTPQHGPLHIPNNEVFDDLDEHGQSLLGSLHLDAEDEPVRRGAASRANSVRFDESALQGANWGQSARHASELAPIRPSSGFGMMERSLSHKSDGRHSSAGHSVHSLASGRGSSLGHIETNSVFGAREEELTVEIPEPPPGLFVLGSVPAIVRCWLTENFAHNTLLYADVCSGAQRSTIDCSLAKQLDLLSDIHKGADGISRLTLTVYLAEAIVSQSNSTRSPGPIPHIPNMTVNFEVTGMDAVENVDSKKSIRIFIGTDALRAHSADLLFSQNLMTLYSSDRDKLSVPFVRPEDDSLFRFLTTTNMVPEKPKLNASAPEFVLNHGGKPSSPLLSVERTSSQSANDALPPREAGTPPRPLALSPGPQTTATGSSSTQSESGAESEQHQQHQQNQQQRQRQQQRQQPLSKKGGNGINGPANGSTKDEPRSVSSSETSTNRPPATDLTGIWGSWRQGAGPAVNGVSDGAAQQRAENGLSGYQPAGRSRMKVLKPSKSAATPNNSTAITTTTTAATSTASNGSAGSIAPSSFARTGASFDPLPPPPRRTSGEMRRKSTSSGTASSVVDNATRWEKRSISGSVSGLLKDAVAKPSSTAATTASASAASAAAGIATDSRPGASSSTPLPRSANPVGVASAFSWMTPAPKPRAPAVGE